MSFLFVNTPSKQPLSASSSSTVSVKSEEELKADALKEHLVKATFVDGTNRGKNLKAKSTGKLNLGEKSLSFLVDGTMPNMTNHLQTLAKTSQQTMVFGTAFITSAAVPTYYSYNFTLSDLADNVASLVLVYDQYKIDLVEVWTTPRVTEWTTQGGSGCGTYITCVDYDDANTPTSMNQLAAYPNNVTTNGTAGHYHRFVPHMAVAVYSGAFTSFANEKANWIDCGSPSVQHYGFKMASSATAAQTGIEISYRYTVSFRALH